eukprot:176986-Prorocentrum_minimum.AAC.1
MKRELLTSAGGAGFGPSAGRALQRVDGVPEPGEHVWRTLPRGGCGEAVCARVPDDGREEAPPRGGDDVRAHEPGGGGGGAAQGGVPQVQHERQGVAAARREPGQARQGRRRQGGDGPLPAEPPPPQAHQGAPRFSLGPSFVRLSRSSRRVGGGRARWRPRGRWLGGVSRGQTLRNAQDTARVWSVPMFCDFVVVEVVETGREVRRG